MQASSCKREDIHRAVAPTLPRPSDRHLRVFSYSEEGVVFSSARLCLSVEQMRKFMSTSQVETVIPLFFQSELTTAGRP